MSPLLPLLFLLAAAPNAAPAEERAGQELCPGVHLIPGSVVRRKLPDGNTVVFEGRDGLVIFDTGRHPEHVEQIAALAGQLGSSPKAIVNSHWHLDHVGGNVLLRQRYPGITVYASDAIAEARTGFLARYREHLSEDLASKDARPEEVTALRAEVALIDAGDRLAPDVVINSTGEHTLAGRKLLIGLERRAVTAGDVWVLDPASHILAAGDLVTLPVPFLDTACPQGWGKALDHLAQQRFDVLVPGHGLPINREGFEIYRNAFHALLECSSSKRQGEACATGWFEAVGVLGANSGDREYDHLMMGYYLKNILRSDAGRASAACSP